MGTRKGLLFALEDDQVQAAPETDFAEVSEGCSDVMEQAGDIENNSATLSDGVDDIEEMGQVQQVMQKSVDSGEGVSEETAQIAEIAVEAICARLGIKKQRTIPSLESFGSKHTRLSATKIAVESVGDKIDSAWKAIKAFFVRMWGHIRTFFSAVWSKLVSFKNNTKDLVKRVFNATFKSGEYTIPGGMTVAEYKAACQKSTEGAKDASEALKSTDEIMAKVTSAAKSGNTAEVFRLIGEAVATSESMSLENFWESYPEKKMRLEKEAAEEKAKMAAEANALNYNESQAKSTATDIVKATEVAASASDQQKAIEQGLAVTEKGVDNLVATAITEGKAAQATIEKNESPEKVAEAKEKLSMWNRIKSWASKTFSAVSSFVTGTFKRVMALIKFGFNWVKMMFSVGVGVVKATAVGGYNAAVKGEA